MNTLIEIGYPGTKIVYLNITIEEAVTRYKKTMETDEIPYGCVRILNFEDEFSAYSIGGLFGLAFLEEVEVDLHTNERSTEV